VTIDISPRKVSFNLTELVSSLPRLRILLTKLNSNLKSLSSNYMVIFYQTTLTHQEMSLFFCLSLLKIFLPLPYYVCHSHSWLPSCILLNNFFGGCTPILLLATGYLDLDFSCHYLLNLSTATFVNLACDNLFTKHLMWKCSFTLCLINISLYSIVLVH